ncbi:MAG: hypothetical protein HYU86_05785 [Chloroflexi bacterium]|nr:hypothetical protein [Chloroflexota bacterium]
MNNPEKEKDERRYFIDVRWYQEKGRSFAFIARSRMCQGCQRRVGKEETEVRVPVVDETSGKVVFEMRKIPYGEDPFTTIGTCCAKKQDFISVRWPLLEAIFRIFLANANQPLTADGVCQRLKEWMAHQDVRRDLSTAVIERLLENDTYYGIRPFVV